MFGNYEDYLESDDELFEEGVDLLYPNIESKEELEEELMSILDKIA